MNIENFFNENEDDELDLFELNVVKIQSIIRKFIVRCKILKDIYNRYEKIFDPKRRRHYYYDKLKDKSSWKKPILLLNNDIDTIAPFFNKSQAAVFIQKNVRKLIALNRVRLLYQKNISEENDESTGLKYFQNKLTGGSMWELPGFMNNRLDYSIKNKTKIRLKTKKQTEVIEPSTLDNNKESAINTEEDDDDDDDENEETQNSSGFKKFSDEDSENISEDSDTKRYKRRISRKYPRSKIQMIVDNAEDNIATTTTLNLSKFGAHFITSRIYDLEELLELNLSHNNLTRLSPNIQYLSKLTHLDISFNRIRSIPQEIEELKELKELKMNNNELSTYPAQLYKLDIQHLNLAKNKFSQIPIERGNLELLKELGQWDIGIGLFKNLNFLDVSNNLIEEWPEQLDMLENLVYLDLSQNSLSVVAPVLGVLKNLKFLNLERNQLESMPHEFFEMNIEELNLKNNKLKDLPIPEDPDLRIYNMKKMDLSHNQLNFLDERISMFYSLEIFDASFNQISFLREKTFSNSKKLVKLNLSNNKISQIEDAGFNSLQSLKSINMSHNLLANITSDIQRSTRIQDMDFSYNALVEIPSKAIAMINDLQVLKLNNNHLKELPPLLFTLKKIQYIDASYNQMSHIHETFSNLSQLTYLDLSHNLIAFIPESIYELKNLEILELRNNKLKYLPNGLSNLKSLRKISLVENELEKSPQLLDLLPSLMNINLSWNLKIPSRDKNWKEFDEIFDEQNEFSSKIWLDRQFAKLRDRYLKLKNEYSKKYKEPVIFRIKNTNSIGLDNDSDYNSLFLSEDNNNEADVSDDDSDIGGSSKKSKLRDNFSGKLKSNLRSKRQTLMKSIKNNNVKSTKKKNSKLNRLKKMFLWHKDLRTHMEQNLKESIEFDSVVMPSILDKSESSKIQFNSKSSHISKLDPSLISIESYKLSQKSQLKDTQNVIEAIILDQNQKSYLFWNSIQQNIKRSQSKLSCIKDLLSDCGRELDLKFLEPFDLGWNVHSLLLPMKNFLKEIDTKVLLEQLKFYFIMNFNKEKHMYELYTKSIRQKEAAEAAKSTRLQKSSSVKSLNKSSSFFNVSFFSKSQKKLTNSEGSKKSTKSLKESDSSKSIKAKELKTQKSLLSFSGLSWKSKPDTGSIKDGSLSEFKNNTDEGLKNVDNDQTPYDRENNTLNLTKETLLVKANESDLNPLNQGKSDGFRKPENELVVQNIEEEELNGEEKEERQVITSLSNAEPPISKAESLNETTISMLSSPFNDEPQTSSPIVTYENTPEIDKKNFLFDLAMGDDPIERISSIQKSHLKYDLDIVPFLSFHLHSMETLIPGEKIDDLLPVVFNSVLLYGKILLLKSQILLDNIRIIEKRGSLASMIDLAQRREDDIDDLFEDIYDSLSHQVELKEAMKSQLSLSDKKKRDASKIMNSLLQSEEPKELNEDEKEGFDSKQQVDYYSNEGLSSQNTNSLSSSGEVSKATTNKNVSLSEILPKINRKNIEILHPIKSTVAQQWVQYLNSHRTLTLLLAYKCIELCYFILKSKGFDSKSEYFSHFLERYSTALNISRQQRLNLSRVSTANMTKESQDDPSYSEKSNIIDETISVDDNEVLVEESLHRPPEWVTHGASELFLIKAQVCKYLYLYEEAKESFQAYFKLCRNKLSLDHKLDYIKIMITQGDYLIAKKQLLEFIAEKESRFHPQPDKSSTVLPIPLDVIRMDKNLGILLEYLNDQIEELRKCEVFSPFQQRVFGVENNGLLHGCPHPSPEIFRGRTLIQDRKLISLKKTRELELKELENFNQRSEIKTQVQALKDRIQILLSS